MKPTQKKKKKKEEIKYYKSLKYWNTYINISQINELKVERILIHQLQLWFFIDFFFFFSFSFSLKFTFFLIICSNFNYKTITFSLTMLYLYLQCPLNYKNKQYPIISIGNKQFATFMNVVNFDINFKFQFDRFKW